jgi:hypothetical protein
LFGTVRSFSSSRLEQLAQLRSEQYPQLSDTERWLSAIHMRKVSTGSELLQLLQSELPRLQRERQDRIKLLILDSLAAIFRLELNDRTVPNNHTAVDDNEWAGTIPHISHHESRAILIECSAVLKQFASEHHVVVVLVNQVSDVILPQSADDSENVSYQLQQEALQPESCFRSGGKLIRAALGMQWSNCITTRLAMIRLPRNYISAQSSEPERRRLKVMFSSHIPPNSCDFRVQANGLVGIRPQQSQTKIEPNLTISATQPQQRPGNSITQLQQYSSQQAVMHHPASSQRYQLKHEPV